jgi:hypothetical protein
MTIPRCVRGIYATLHGWVIAKRIAHMGRFADLVVLKRWIGVQQLNFDDSSSLRGVYWLDYRGRTFTDEGEFPARRIIPFLVDDVQPPVWHFEPIFSAVCGSILLKLARRKGKRRAARSWKNRSNRPPHPD